MKHGELAICVTSGYRISHWSNPTSSLEAEAIVYGTGGVTFARFKLGAGGAKHKTEAALRERVQRRAQAWIDADPKLRARMQSLEHKSYSARGFFWRLQGV